MRTTRAGVNSRPSLFHLLTVRVSSLHTWCTHRGEPRTAFPLAVEPNTSQRIEVMSWSEEDDAFSLCAIAVFGLGPVLGRLDGHGAMHLGDRDGLAQLGSRIRGLVQILRDH